MEGSVGVKKIIEEQGDCYVPLYVKEYDSVIISERAKHTGIMGELYRYSIGVYDGKVELGDIPNPSRSAELFIENGMGWYLSGAHNKIIVPESLLKNSLLKAYQRKTRLPLDINGWGYESKKAMFCWRNY